MYPRFCFRLRSMHARTLILNETIFKPVDKMMVPSHDVALTQEAEEKLAALNLTLRRGEQGGHRIKGKSQNNSKHITSPLKCDYCEYKSPNRYYVLAHEIEKHKGTKQNCTECDFSNYFSSKIRKHFKLVHLRIPRRKSARSCDECDFKTEMVIGWDSLKHHKESVHEGIVYTCKICPNYTTTNRETFRGHNDKRHSKKREKGMY